LGWDVIVPFVNDPTAERDLGIVWGFGFWAWVSLELWNSETEPETESAA